MLSPAYTLTWCDRMGDIPQADWDRLALPYPTPFLEWAWLNNLETSRSVAVEAGWRPQHLTLWRQDNPEDPLTQRLVAAAPLYIKGDSYGEFVFDQEWAALSERLGVRYYPKLLGMTPFTPAEGYRFLLDPTEDGVALTATMMAAIDQFCQENQIAGCHFLFVDPEWRLEMEGYGFQSWLHHSYIWQNQGYGSFADFLADFNANQRRNIKRERAALQKADLSLAVYTGAEIPSPFFRGMHRFYSGTCDKFMWGSKYLTRRFFEQLEDSYRDRVVFLAAAHNGTQDSAPLGMSFCIRKGEVLYGRYWGSDREYDSLHFNACYYEPIDWAISQGIQRFDPGAGGRHKKRRGFPATPNYSLHRIYAPRLEALFTHYLPEINAMEAEQIQAINQELPYQIRL
jgi:uncharacterized protein